MWREILTAAALSLAIASPAQAENWVYVSSPVSGGEAYLDMDSIQVIEGTAIAAWMLRTDSRGYDESVARVIIDCEIQYWSLLEIYIYNPYRHLEFTDDLQSASIPPGSVISHFADAACANAFLSH